MINRFCRGGNKVINRLHLPALTKGGLQVVRGDIITKHSYTPDIVLTFPSATEAAVPPIEDVTSALKRGG